MEETKRIIEYLTNEILRTSNDISCSAEWLYAKGYHEAIYNVLRFVEKIGNEQQKQG